MKVLIACEYSGVVSRAFQSKGHEVVSCDLLPNESPRYSSVGSFRHYTGDIFDIINSETWDLMIAFPPCTYLCRAQMFRTKKDYYSVRTALAYNFVLRLYYSNIKFIALENPIGWLNTNWKKPDQITSPHMFGSPYRKDICLWLKNLCPLIEGQPSPGLKRVSNHVNSRMSQALKSKIKSKFFPEVAEAMAVQWSNFIDMTLKRSF